VDYPSNIGRPMYEAARSVMTSPHHIYLPNTPVVIDVTHPFTLRYDYAMLWTAADTLLVSGTDYTVEEDSGRLTLLRPLARHYRALKLIYSGGYAVTPATTNPDVPANMSAS